MTAERQQTEDEQRSFDAQRSRELFERRQQTNLDLGRTISFKPTYSPAIGPWNLFLCVLGAAILAAIVVVNVFY